ncbi:ABC-F family ATP-binding cassette domain-containing protein [Desulfitobacterium chlororespirans]|uniref:ATP-binding cassette, subfamily F, uup n=1 Tax=Desulfitobacterium chlororespirans DSM 11544 TaxID=1121395 RepID=A0A1M7UQH9_9FIRM|nr:ABC-F family ATP-binding cassette domain-containing protein [Desulfitobacterium chlororespirans]SHN85209.1 ATP-binding cassette, subfamily F, uup [Desulfitobacterium chlororespirans DSM 11544]
MNLLTAESLSKSYGIKPLFQDISLGIEEGQKIGLIGVNGTGKSTLLKILAGLEQPEQGQITTNNELQLEYLPQEPDFDPEATVLQQVFKGNSPLMKLLRDYETALERLNQDPNSESYQNTLLQLGQKMDSHNAWQIESEAKAVLTKLGITQFDIPIGTLSGGQRKRVALAGALIQPSNVLILDEPTNHIDNEMVDWLENYLHKLKGALLMVTHDRYFLDRVANRIFELDRGKLYAYPGNYSRFLELKAERDEQEEASERKRQNILRNELAWMRRGAQARTTKQKARIDRFEQLQADQPEEKTGKVNVSTGAARLGKKVIQCSHLRKSYPGSGMVIADFSIILAKYDRIGIIGPNGSGKSTLLNILAGRIEADAGEIEWGPTVKLGYFAQEYREFEPQTKVIDVIKAVAEVIPTSDGGVLTASQMLERFLFTPAQQWTPVEKLSGGEKRRLYLLQVLMSSPNVLLLDEPTNDLDIQTLSILEDYLENFPGVVITVSHDRFFLDRVVEQILAFEGQGRIHSSIGNYTDYREHLARRIAEEQFSRETLAKAQKLSGQSSKPGEVEETGNQAKPKERLLKMSYKEQREYEQIEDRIAGLEGQLEQVNQGMAEAGSNYGKLNELLKTKDDLEKQLEESLERWTYLSELAEEIAGRKSPQE